MNILDDKQSTHSRFAASLCPNSVARSPVRDVDRSIAISSLTVDDARRRSHFVADRALDLIARMLNQSLIEFSPFGNAVQVEYLSNLYS